MESQQTKRGLGAHNRVSCYICYEIYVFRYDIIVKHSIRLTDNTPFKEHYWWIPPSMYEEVREHLKEILEIGAIWPSHSPWASLVIQVCKKDGKLWFCIDLRKLNAHTIKDSYSLPRIDTLGSLNGTVWFTAQDLKSGSWQVKMDEASKAMIAFILGLLGFYDCDCIPFGLVNAQSMFQRLMETCLGNLQLNWCLIYLDDVGIFENAKDHLVQLRAVFKKL